MRKFKNTLYFMFIPLFIVCCNNKNSMSSIEIKKLDYPSASSIEFVDRKLYLMGDDATYLLVLDTNLNILDSIPLLSHPETRIPKETKPDLEASVVNTENLFLFGSGSLSPYRNLGLKYNFQTQDTVPINLDP